MNTRYSVRNEYQTIISQKLTLKASQSEVMHDLQQMTDEPVKDIIRKHSRDLDVPDIRPKANPTKRSKVVNPKTNEVASSILGFATFINEIQYQKPKKKPAKKQKAQTKQTTTKKPQIQLQPQTQPKLKTQAQAQPKPQTQAQTQPQTCLLYTSPSPRDS